MDFQFINSYKVDRSVIMQIKTADNALSKSKAMGQPNLKFPIKSSWYDVFQLSIYLLQNKNNLNYKLVPSSRCPRKHNYKFINGASQLKCYTISKDGNGYYFFLPMELAFFNATAKFKTPLKKILEKENVIIPFSSYNNNRFFNSFFKEMSPLYDTNNQFLKIIHIQVSKVIVIDDETNEEETDEEENEDDEKIDETYSEEEEEEDDDEDECKDEINEEEEEDDDEEIEEEKEDYKKKEDQEKHINLMGVGKSTKNQKKLFNTMGEQLFKEIIKKGSIENSNASSKENQNEMELPRFKRGSIENSNLFNEQLKYQLLENEKIENNKLKRKHERGKIFHENKKHQKEKERERLEKQEKDEEREKLEKQDKEIKEKQKDREFNNKFSKELNDILKSIIEISKKFETKK